MTRMFSFASGIFTFSKRLTRWLVVLSSFSSKRICSASDDCIEAAYSRRLSTAVDPERVV